jgi:hypothetical protein
MSLGSRGIDYYFTASGGMSEQDSFGIDRCLMREFVSAGGELIIRGALN